jgi:hypothetical protein
VRIPANNPAKERTTFLSCNGAASLIKKPRAIPFVLDIAIPARKCEFDSWMNSYSSSASALHNLVLAGLQMKQPTALLTTS